MSNPGSNEDEDEDDFWPWTFGAVGESRLQRAVVECVKDRPHLGVTVVNLTYCFNLHRQHGIVHQ
ncbi:hypothetical protein Rumeso_05004 [Rubellimicrobium mesophilum DSM 19309]|uniref:Uncharacterized protein n=1 Tax=Rubellimicrobium mesophilum DSM 19309 TaxID=442562 RepID=A0A017HBV6_9RHOB|nr:hypothetical protein Rumeso_05004 [Rubellimicrobium mesophilum DSM 19309]